MTSWNYRLKLELAARCANFKSHAISNCDNQHIQYFFENRLCQRRNKHLIWWEKKTLFYQKFISGEKSDRIEHSIKEIEIILYTPACQCHKYNRSEHILNCTSKQMSLNWTIFRGKGEFSFQQGIDDAPRQVGWCTELGALRRTKKWRHIVRFFKTSLPLCIKLKIFPCGVHNLQQSNKMKHYLQNIMFVMRNCKKPCLDTRSYTSLKNWNDQLS